MLDAIIVIPQYARDQAMGSARDQAAKVSLRRVDDWITITENTHPAFVWSLRRTVSSCRIAILHLPDNYNRLQTSVGGLVCTACMRRRLGRPDTYSLKILATSLRKAINNRNTKLMVETKTSPYMHDIELHFTKKKKGHKQEIKKISIEIKRM